MRPNDEFPRAKSSSSRSTGRIVSGKERRTTKRRLKGQPTLKKGGFGGSKGLVKSRRRAWENPKKCWMWPDRRTSRPDEHGPRNLEHVLRSQRKPALSNPRIFPTRALYNPTECGEREKRRATGMGAHSHRARNISLLLIIAGEWMLVNSTHLSLSWSWISFTSPPFYLLPLFGTICVKMTITLLP